MPGASVTSRYQLLYPLDWQVAMKQAFTAHKRYYGTRQLRAELQAQGHRVGRQRLRAELPQHGLRAL